MDMNKGQLTVTRRALEYLMNNVDLTHNEMVAAKYAYWEIDDSLGCKYTFYPALSLSIDDAIRLDRWYRGEEAAQPHYQRIYESLSNQERRDMAEELGDWIYDGDKWDQALAEALDSIAVNRE